MLARRVGSVHTYTSGWLRLSEKQHSKEGLTGLFQLREIGQVCLKFKQPVSLVERDHSFKTPPCGNRIPAAVVYRGKVSEHRCFSRLVAELDVMFRGIVETTLGSSQVTLIEKALAELAVGHRQPFFVSDSPMRVERLHERRDSLLPFPFASLLECQVVVKNAERTIVFEVAQQIQRFKVVGAGFFRMVGADVKITQIYQRMCDGMLIPFYPLDLQNFPITALCLIQIAQ